MRVTTILGSPRTDGNTATVLEWVEAELIAGGHEVDRVTVKDYEINGCIECYSCLGDPDAPNCPQEDDAVQVLERMMRSDAVLYASPLFCWGWSAQIKPLIDRHFCLVTGYATEKHISLMDGKRTGLLVTCGGPDEGNADLIGGMYERLMGYVRARPAAKLVVPFCTTADAIPEYFKEQAVKLAHDLIGA